MAVELRRQTQARLAAVTQGAQGLTVSSQSCDEPFTSPAFASKVVDRVGAGDALFATLASLWAIGAEEQLAAFLANLAGALSVSGLGNSVIVTAQGLLKSAASFIE
jgi:bifunctional ADP-heptose synthase (sugar kinase/adenylyltransferase)